MSNDAQAPTKIRTATPTETREIPKLNELVKNKHAERTEELSRLAGTSGITDAAKPTETPKSRDFGAEIEALDPDLRTHYEQQITGRYNASLSEQYADILPLIEESRNNPGLRKNLAKIAEEQELRDILTDENAPTRLKKTANKKLSRLYEDDDFAEFAITEALPVYEDPQYGIRKSTPVEPQRTRELDRIEALEKKYDSDRDLTTRKGYVSDRIRERFALEAKYPVLGQNQAMREKVLGRAENDFVERARIAGVKVDDSSNPGWPAQAMRAGIKPMSYLDAYNDYASFMPSPASEAAPTGAVGDTRATRVPPMEKRALAKPQARPSKDELRSKGVAALQNLRSLARKG